MKKSFLIIILMTLLMLTSMTVFASDSDFSDYTEFSQSAEYSEITVMETEILSRVEEIYEIQYNQVPDDFPELLDFSKISKVYVDTNIEDIGISDKNAIEGVLSQSTYVWVIPIESGGKNFYITLAKGLPLDESKAMALAEEEKAQVQESVGKWKITEIAERPIKPYSETLEENIGEMSIDDTVLVGGIPGMQMPVAIGFQDNQAASWIKAGYEYPVLEEIPAAYSSNGSVYDFDIVLQKLDEYDDAAGVVTGGATGNVNEVLKENSPRIYAAAGCLIVMCVLVVLYLIKRKI